MDQTTHINQNLVQNIPPVIRLSLEEWQKIPWGDKVVKFDASNNHAVSAWVKKENEWRKVKVTNLYE